MKKIGTSMAFAMLMILAPSASQAKGCIKGALVGGIAGHYAGHHGLLGIDGQLGRLRVVIEDRIARQAMIQRGRL